MATRKKEISGSALAKELKASPSSITHLLKTGVLEMLPSGKFNRLSALQAIVSNSSGSGGGWGSQSYPGRASLQERAEKLLGGIATDFPRLDFSDLENGPASSHDQQPAEHDDQDREKLQFFLDYGHAHGMAYLARALRDPGRMDVVRNLLTEDFKLTAEQSLKVVRLFAYLPSAWIAGVLREVLGKKTAKEFDKELSEWIGTFSEEVKNEN